MTKDVFCTLVGFAKKGVYYAAGRAREAIKEQGSGQRDSVTSKGSNTRVQGTISYLPFKIPNLKEKKRKRAAYSRVLWACLETDLPVLDSVGDSRST